MQINKIFRTIVETVNSFPLLVSEDFEKLLFERLISNSSAFPCKPCKRIPIKMWSHFKSMNMWGNRHIIVSYRNFCVCRSILSQISWIKISTSFPFLCFSFQKASFRIVDCWMVRDIINLITIVNFFVISLKSYWYINVINLIDPKYINLFISRQVKHRPRIRTDILKLFCILARPFPWSY